MEEMEIRRIEEGDEKQVSNLIRKTISMDYKYHMWADTAMRFAIYFGTTPQFWFNIQNQYDLDMLKVSGKIADMFDIRPYNLMQR